MKDDYIIALQQAIEHHCNGKPVPDNIANKCPHHAAMLNNHLTSRSRRAADVCALWDTCSLKLGPGGCLPDCAKRTPPA